MACAPVIWGTRMSRRAVYSWVLGATIVAIVVRLPGLDREITHDEAYSWLGYASMPYATLLSTYDMPNNHLLHSAAMRLSSRMFGGDQEWVLRAPAFVAGVVTIPMMAGLATAALGSPVAGIVAAWWMALHPSHISYSNTARGYALLVLFGALSWWSVVLAFQGRPRFWIVFAVAAFLATWTIPSGVFLLLALGGWALVTAWRRGGATGADPFYWQRQQRSLPVSWHTWLFSRNSRVRLSVGGSNSGQSRRRRATRGRPPERCGRAAAVLLLSVAGGARECLGMGHRSVSASAPGRCHTLRRRSCRAGLGTGKETT